MSVTIKSIKGYYFLDAWVMAHIIQLSTQRYANTFLNQKNDPCGRMYDQMTMAARSVTANIAEGASRHQTSRETEMRLTDVARASLSELLGDFFHLSMRAGCEPWSKHSEAFRRFAAIQLDRPVYTDDWDREAWLHIMRQKKKYDPWIESSNHIICLNSMMALINRLISILQKMLEAQLEAFRAEGGFAENMNRERTEALRAEAVREKAPACPLCGKPMLRRMAKRGKNSGRYFWSCSDYPDCHGTRSCEG